MHTRTPTPLALCSGDDFKKKKVTNWGATFQIAIDQRLLAVPPVCEAAFKKLCALTHRLHVHARVRDCARVLLRSSARARVRSDVGFLVCARTGLPACLPACLPA